MFQSVSQDKVIKHLNQYFKAQNLPLTLDTGGICNGLAHVYAQYCLFHDEEKFMRILRVIASGQMDGVTHDNEINLFITQVFLSFIPQQYNKELSQATAIKALGKPIETVFELGAVLSNKDWQRLIMDIELQEDEVILVNSVDHTIAISRKQGKYVVYDPNYDAGTHTFKNERSLVQELAHNIFNYKDKVLGMRVHIVKKDSQITSLRNPLFFYQRYITANNVNKKASAHAHQTNTLLLAIECNDEASIDYLLAQGAEVTDVAIAKAVIDNHNNTLPKLLSKMVSLADKSINSFLILALRQGRWKAFATLMREEQFNTQFHTIFLNTNKALSLQYAAEGGNLDLLKYVFNACQTNTTPYHELDRVLSNERHTSNILKSAIKGQSKECSAFILQALKQRQIELSPIIKTECMVHAIQSNDLYVFSLLLEELQPTTLKQLHLKLALIEKTNVHILKQLQAQGVIFSPRAQALIARKEQRSIGLLLAIGIEIEKFMDFIAGQQDIALHRHSFFSGNESNKCDGENGQVMSFGS